MSTPKESMHINADGKKFYEGNPLKHLSFILKSGQTLIEYILTHRNGRLSISKVREIKIGT